MTAGGSGRAVRVRVPAKVNLHLSVGDLRSDGYHDLVTVFCAVGLYDDVTVSPADSLQVAVAGLPGAPTGPDNLAARAAVLLAERTGVDPAVRLEIAKSIPVAGGMAGGSADAAAALLACNALWRTGLDRAQLLELAAQLGSDVPFALVGGVAIGTGRGEKLVPVLSRTPLHWVFALSGTGLSTPAVFRELDRLREQGDMPRLGGTDPVLAALVSGEPATVARALGNDLQAAAISLQPGLRRVLYVAGEEGVLGALVSGSGPTVAMLCRDAGHAADVAARIAGQGVCRSVRVATGPVPGARILGAES